METEEYDRGVIHILDGKIHAIGSEGEVPVTPKEGEQVIVGTREQFGKPGEKSSSNPFMPGPPQRTKR